MFLFLMVLCSVLIAPTPIRSRSMMPDAEQIYVLRKEDRLAEQLRQWELKRDAMQARLSSRRCKYAICLGM